VTLLIDGRAQAAALRARVAQEVRRLMQARGIVPRLEVILMGEHPAGLAYVATKTRMAAEVGIAGHVNRLAVSAPESELLATLERLNRDPAVHGILVQLPLPAHVDAARVLESVDPAKDVDGFHPLNIGRLVSGTGSAARAGLVPCTPRACLMLIESVLGAGGLAGRRATVVGRSNIVGKPVAALLLAADCTVTVAHSRTRALADECRRAEILIAAIGRPALVRGDWIGEGAIVIDVGINRIAGSDGSSRLVGDVAFAEARARAAAITPVPGGVGPMTVACLLENTLLAACRQIGVPV
jgi:methylenetetrahydrofolate dehydrogenase (NADP+)/methenyltetrahydrofolate cyclohydrolase